MKRTYPLFAASVILASCQSGQEYDATGIFEATTVTISAETSGKILTLDVSEGDSIVKGQLLAVIDTVSLTLQKKQIASQCEATESGSPDISAQAASLRAQIKHQQQDCERYAKLLSDGATTQKTVDDANARLNTLNGQLDALLSTLGKNKSSISGNVVALRYQGEQIEEQIRKSSITSPLTGTVLTKYAEPGEYAMPGKPLVKVADLNNIYLRSYFTATQLADIKIGQTVTVIADFGADARYEYAGTVVWISEESEFTPKSIQTPDSRSNLVYAVKVAVKNDGRLKLGQYGEVCL